MSRTTPKQSFRNSLLHNIAMHHRDFPDCFKRLFFVAAPVWELEDEPIPMTLDLLYDVPQGDRYQRVYFHLKFERIVRENGDLVAYYSVTAD